MVVSVGLSEQTSTAWDWLTRRAWCEILTYSPRWGAHCHSHHPSDLSAHI